MTEALGTLGTSFLDPRSNSIPWCTSFHVYHWVRDITWSLFYNTRVMNIAVLDMYGFQTCFGSAASAFENIELAYIHCALKECFSVTLKGYTCFIDLSRTTCALCRNYKHKVWDSKRLGNWKVRVVKGIFVARDQRFFFPWNVKWLFFSSWIVISIVAVKRDFAKLFSVKREINA